MLLHVHYVYVHVHVHYVYVHVHVHVHCTLYVMCHSQVHSKAFCKYCRVAHEKVKGYTYRVRPFSGYHGTRL